MYNGSSITVSNFKADQVIYKRLKEFALQGRGKPTKPEEFLWQKLRGKKEGYKFRRQHIIGTYIADFVCLKKGLVIEIDGSIHQLPEMQNSDEQRTAELNKLGFEVMRISNEDVLTNTENVIQKITEKLQTLPDKKNDEFLEEEIGRAHV